LVDNPYVINELKIAVQVSVIVLQRDPAFWGKDADAFDDSIT